MKVFMKKAIYSIIIVLGIFYLWRDWPVYNELYEKIFKSKLELSLEKDNLYIKNNPNNPSSYDYRGATYKNHKMYKEALKDFLKAYELSNESFLFLKDISNTYLALGDTEKAYEYIFKVIKRHPKLKSNFFDLAIIYDYEYKSKEAIKAYTTVINSISPSSSDGMIYSMFSYKRRAFHYILQNEIEKAKIDLEYYLGEKKEDKEAISIKEMISQKDKINTEIIREKFKLNVNEAISLFYTAAHSN